MQQKTCPVDKGENVFPFETSVAEQSLPWHSEYVKVDCLTVRAQVTGFQTVAGEVRQISCMS